MESNKIEDDMRSIIEIYLRLPDGHLHRCWINSLSTAWDIERFVLDLDKRSSERLKSGQLMVVYLGRCMHDSEQMLVDYGVSSGAILAIHSSCRGGTRSCFSFFQRRKSRQTNQVQQESDIEKPDLEADTAVAIDMPEIEVRTHLRSICMHLNTHLTSSHIIPLPF
jgi:hypothetical protein